MPQMNPVDLSFMNPQPVNSIADFAGDVGKIMDVRKKGATLESDIAKNKAESEKSQLELNAAQQGVIGKTIGALMTNEDIREGKDPLKMSMAIQRQADQAIRSGVPAEVVQGATKHLFEMAHNDPKSIMGVLNDLQASQMDSQTQYKNRMELQKTGGTDIAGNPTQLMQNPVSGELRQAPLGTVGDTANQQMRVPVNETPETLKGFQENRNEALKASQAAPQALNNIDNVLKYLPMAELGNKSEAIAGMQSLFGNLAGDTAAEKAASARDIIQKNITDLGLQKNAALGGKFQGDLQAALGSLADAGKNPTAIAKSMQQLKPLMQHAQNYQKGLEATIDKHGIGATRKYNNEMADAFDPTAMQVYNAFKSGNKKDFEEITKDMSETKKRELSSKIKRYNRLTTEGI